MFDKLHLDNLSISYGRLNLLANLSGSFVRGRINLIVGRAGSGKSTLLRTLAGFHKDFTGSILADDKVFAPHGNISLVFQNPEALFFNGSVGEEVGYALKMRNVSAQEVEQTAKAWLQKWGLSPEKYWHRHPLELSGGEKRRLALAACTVFVPPVVLLDEPLAGLDVRGQRDLADMLAKMTENHIVIVVTDEPETLLAQSGSLLCLQAGEGQWLSPDGFLRQALTDSAFFPLPEWYRASIEPYKTSTNLPTIKADAVWQFLQRRKNNNADLL